jgi:hypothetical protein
MSPDVRSELRTGLVVTGGCLLAGVLVGLFWWGIAPLAQLVKRPDGIFVAGGAGETAIAADGWFALCSATAGLVAALVVFARMRRARLGPLLGLVIGGIAGAVVAWRLGVLLGPAGVRATAKDLAFGEHFNGPLQLSAHGVLFAWPLTSTVAYFALTAGLEPKAGTDLAGHRFPVTVLRPGYSIAEVDDAFGRLDAGLLPAEEMRELHFSSSRWRQGYDEMSVDAAMAAGQEIVSGLNENDESARPSLG